MITIDTKAYILRFFVDIILFYLLFFTLNKQGTKMRRLVLALFFIPITFFVGLYTSVSDVIPIIASYLLLKRKGEQDYFLLSNLLLCELVIDSVNILSSTVMVSVLSKEHVIGFLEISLQIGLKIILLSLFIWVYKKYRIQRLFEKLNAEWLALLLMYLFLIISIVTYAAHYYQVFDQFVVGIIVFIVIQMLFVIFLFSRALKQQKTRFEEKMVEQEMVHLKKYTTTLEQQEQQMSKFRNDYQKRLCDFKEASNTEQNSHLTEQIQALEYYSDKCLLKDKFDDQVKQGGV